MDYATRAIRYAERVVSGRIIAGEHVIGACKRFLKDRKRKRFPYLYVPERANRICEFIEELRHVKGHWKTPTIVLEDWQCFILCNVFGWVDSEGFRRFRTVYVEVPRKNAKTTLCAGVGLYMLALDNEQGAEVYSAAVTRDQARISFDIGRRQALLDAQLRADLDVECLAHSIIVPSLGASWKPLAHDADSLDGLNIHCAIIDELHAHKTREVFDAIDTATGSRRQPLKWIITTAGSNRSGVCYEQRKYVTEILRGNAKDERYFGVVYGIDKTDDWTKPAAWKKANPNYGVSVLPDDILTGAKQAESNPQTQNNFKTKRLNVWVSVGTAYFNMLAWDRCKHDMVEADFEKCRCWFALDLASKWDIASFMRLYEREPGKYAIFGSHYLPEDSVEPGKPNYDFYSGWAKEGRIILTPGAITDYEFIERDLLDWAYRAGPEHIGYDPWQATELATKMVYEGLPMVEIPMTVRHLSEPMKAVAGAILTGDIWHQGDPVLNWMVGNVMAKEDAKENVYPTKETPQAKIDGAVGMIMAWSRALSAGVASYSTGVFEIGA